MCVPLFVTPPPPPFHRSHVRWSRVIQSRRFLRDTQRRPVCCLSQQHILRLQPLHQRHELVNVVALRVDRVFQIGNVLGNLCVSTHLKWLPRKEEERELTS